MIFKTSLQERFLLKKKSVILNWRWQFIWNSLWVYLVQEKSSAKQNGTLTIWFRYNFLVYYRVFLHFCVMQKALQLPLFSSLCSSLQQIWTDWWNLLIEFSLFVNLDECGSIRTNWRNVMWQIFYFSLKFYVLYMKQKL